MVDRRDSVVDRKHGAVVFVADGDRGARARRVPRDIGERFLRATVERKAWIGREHPGFAFDPKPHVEIHVRPVTVDQRRELGKVRKRISAQCADGLAGVGKPIFDQLAGAVNRLTKTRRGVPAVGELPRPLQLDRGT